MKVLWISHLLPYPPHGGVRQRSYHLLRKTAESYDVHLVALYQHPHQPTKEKLAEAVSHFEQFCVAVDVFPMRTNQPLWKYGYVIPSSFIPSDWPSTIQSSKTFRPF